MYVSILGLVDIGLRHSKVFALSPHLYVSILGLVDLGLRQDYRKLKKIINTIVSILGLVDLGLRLDNLGIIIKVEEGFNPWFSGFRVET